MEIVKQVIQQKNFKETSDVLELLEKGNHINIWRNLIFNDFDSGEVMVKIQLLLFLTKI